MINKDSMMQELDKRIHDLENTGTEPIFEDSIYYDKCRHCIYKDTRECLIADIGRDCFILQEHSFSDCYRYQCSAFFSQCFVSI